MPGMLYDSIEDDDCGIQAAVQADLIAMRTSVTTVPYSLPTPRQALQFASAAAAIEYCEVTREAEYDAVDTPPAPAQQEAPVVPGSPDSPDVIAVDSSGSPPQPVAPVDAAALTHADTVAGLAEPAPPVAAITDTPRTQAAELAEDAHMEAVPAGPPAPSPCAAPMDEDEDEEDDCCPP